MKKLYHYAPMLILTIFTSLFFVLMQLTLFGNSTVFDPAYYVKVITDSGSDDALYDEINAYFSQLSKATGIPQETYMKSFTKEKVSKAARKLTIGSMEYVCGEIAEKPVSGFDFTEYEADVTDYIEKYSEENKIEKDDEYYKLIDNTLKVSEKKVDSLFDVMMTERLASSGVTSISRKVVPKLNILIIGSIVLVAIFLGMMWYVDRHHPFDMLYWGGAVLFSSAGLLLIPTLYIRFTGYFDGLFLDQKSVYYAITGALYGVTDRIILVDLILLAVGILLIVFAQIVHNIRIRNAHRRED